MTAMPYVGQLLRAFHANFLTSDKQKYCTFQEQILLGTVIFSDLSPLCPTVKEQLVNNCFSPSSSRWVYNTGGLYSSLGFSSEIRIIQQKHDHSKARQVPPLPALG